MWEVSAWPRSVLQNLEEDQPRLVHQADAQARDKRWRSCALGHADTGNRN